MIRAVADSQAEASYHAALAGLASPPAAQLGCHQQAFGALPGSGWRFFTGGEGQPPFALMQRGSYAWLCGPAQQEELADFFAFLGVKSLLAGQNSLPPAGFVPGPVLHWLVYDPLAAPLPPPAPAGCILTQQAPMADVLAFFQAQRQESESFWADYYADACTKRNRQLARIWAACQNERLVATGGAYALYQGRAYIAGVQTAARLRGKGLGSWLVASMAAQLAGEGFAAELLCEAPLVAFYTALGFVQKSLVQEWVKNENEKE